MKLPDEKTFTVYDVLELVGKDRKIEVMEVNEQKGKYMKLEDFIQYRTELLNVLSLEFSLTKLANIIETPKFVQKIDWIDNVWPRELHERQIVHMKTNGLSDFSTYPKVQRYCLMSVAQCFTDFHVDFGGTSVWYHILKGKKIFWLVEPTDQNLLLHEEWLLSGNSSESFFGRVVNKCTRVELEPGMTFIIPSGWIHCVFTPVDSLVFGGNFLHSYSIPMQIRIVKLEDRVGSKYRFPHLKQMMWYVIESIVRNATGRIYLKPIKAKAYLSQQPKNKEERKSLIKNKYTACLQSIFNIQSDLCEEPTSSSVLEFGCKKTGITKGNGFNNVGMEDSDEESITEFSLDESITSDIICYDDIGNGADVNFSL